MNSTHYHCDIAPIRTAFKPIHAQRLQAVLPSSTHLLCPSDVEPRRLLPPRSDERKAAATSGEGGSEDSNNALMEMGKLNTARIKKVRRPYVAGPFAPSRALRGRRLPWSNCNAVYD